MSVALVIGGARSGKSTFAENKTKEFGGNTCYLATAVITDQGMADRVKKHKEQRPREWTTIEIYKDFAKLENNIDFLNSKTIMIDCITTLIGNFMFDSGLDFDSCKVEDVNILEAKIKEDVLSLVSLCKKLDKNLVLVSNEVGLGIVPAYYMGNYFRDISGRINASVAALSDNVYFMVAGIPMHVKGN